MSEPVDPVRAREVAREILEGRAYRGGDTPRPLAGPLRWVGERLRPVGDFFSSVVDWTAGRLGGPLGVILLAVAVVAIVAFAVWRAVRRSRAVDEAAAGGGAPGGPGELGAETLERQAAEADRRGDHSLAIRLRFRAGLVRLDAARAITLRPSLTSGQVARQIRRADLDELAVTFDAVAYGGRVGRPDQSEQARLTWPRIVAEAGARGDGAS